jgi:hypothetical protein
MRATDRGSRSCGNAERTGSSSVAAAKDGQGQSAPAIGQLLLLVKAGVSITPPQTPARDEQRKSAGALLVFLFILPTFPVSDRVLCSQPFQWR